MNPRALPLQWGRGGLPASPRRILLVQISAMGDQIPKIEQNPSHIFRLNVGFYNLC
jgi:hypothetical protein